MAKPPQAPAPAEESAGSQRSGRPRDARIDTAVPSAVMEILDEVGYGNLTLEAVAARAGTSKPALRRRWRSRQHLVVDALAAHIGTEPTPDTGCTHCDLIAGVSTLGHAATTAALGRRVLPALVADLAGDPELEAAFLDKFFSPRRASTAEALRRGISRGDIRADVDIDLLLDMLASATYYRMLFGHLPVTVTLAEDVVEVVLAGVATDQWHIRHGRQGGLRA